jgi:hypothetical protein
MPDPKNQDQTDEMVTPEEYRVIIARMLATSHARFAGCPHANCRRQRLCVGRDFACMDKPFKFDIERFVDWRG